MTIRKIVMWPDTRLSRACAPVADPDEVENLIADLFQTMYAANGRGLAAPQIGVLKRVFVMDVTWKDGARAPLACINPTIEALGDEAQTGTEVCLSIPGVEAQVSRPARIRLTWTDADGNRQSRDMDGAWARCAQHELDHLDGRVTLDRLSPEDRAEIEARFGAVA